MKSNKKTLLLISLGLILSLSGCKGESHQGFKSLSAKYKTIAIADVRFDTRILMPKDDGSFVVKKEKKGVSVYPLTNEEKMFLQKTATDAISAFGASGPLHLIPSDKVVSDPVYTQLKKESVSDALVVVPPYENVRLDAVSAKKLANSLNTDCVATLRFSYFYAFRGTVKGLANPKNLLKGLGAVTKLREPQPNAMGIITYVTVFNASGKKILDTAFTSMLGEGAPFVIPGYAFHLYPETKTYMMDEAALLKKHFSEIQGKK